MTRIETVWAIEDLNISAAFVPNALLEWEDGESERMDIWYWFASVAGRNRWFAFAMSDDASNPHEMLSDSDLDELRKMSIWVGDPWRVIDHYGVAESANLHRDKLNKVFADDILEEIMETDDDDLRRLRAQGELEQTSEEAGIALSSN